MASTDRVVAALPRCGTAGPGTTGSIRWVGALRRVETQTRTAGRMVAAGAPEDQVVLRIVAMIKTLRSLAAEVSCGHLSHCALHRRELGPAAGVVAAAELAEAIRELLQD